MFNTTLNFTIHTVDDEVLFPANTELSTDTLSALISEQGAVDRQSSPFLRYRTIKDDLVSFLTPPPYSAIFRDRQHIEDLLKSVESVHLADPILRSLYHFKERDIYSYRHSLVVFALSCLLAKDLIPKQEDYINWAATALTHDIGRSCLPAHILKKSGPLTQAENRTLDDHTVAGYILLSYYLRDTKALASKVARDHHERQNGSGYPRGIQLRDRRVEIIAVCDVYDALISPRPYRKTPYDNRTALEVIAGMAERAIFGWDALKALVGWNRKVQTHYSEISISLDKRGTPPSGDFYGVIAKGKPAQ
ncbi:MAG: HD domain-containing protein [Deltaproteobacteria bacterium]|nr:HD domain-containing protein [Deltaproteobacteria bacterium]